MERPNFNVTFKMIHLRQIQLKKIKFQYLVNLFIPYYCHFYCQSYLFVVIIQWLHEIIMSMDIKFIVITVDIYVSNCDFELKHVSQLEFEIASLDIHFVSFKIQGWENVQINHR